MDLLLAIGVPDSKIVVDARELARESSEPFLFNHVMRSWLFAALLARRSKTPPDPELLAIAALLHDLGLTERFSTDDHRFEVDSANAAKSFLTSYNLTLFDVMDVWDAIALHSTRSIALHKGSLASLCHSGVQVDVSGFRYDEVDPATMQRILDDYPRMSFKQKLAECLCAVVRRKPATTVDNFLRDFGERYVPDYRAMSPVDRLEAAPFES